LSLIHPTAIVDKNAIIGNNVPIGPFSIINDNVKSGDNCIISSNVLISSGTELGDGCSIHNGAVLGTDPQDLKFEDEQTFLTIGKNTTIREFATLNRATSHSYYTRIGENCLLMAYTHVAHDCQLGNNVIMSNSVNLAGHVEIKDFVTIGGLTAVHQFVKIAIHSFIGGGLRISKDIPPYILAMGEPLRFGGLNKIGLQRRDFTPDIIKVLNQAYKVLYRRGFTVKEAIKELSDEFKEIPEVMNLVEFLKNNDRGILR